MDSFIEPSEIETAQLVTSNRLHQNNLKIAVQSALAAGLCLGLPAGLFFWLIIAQRGAPSHLINTLVKFFQDYVVPPVILEMLGAFGWGLLLSKISGYRQWWSLSIATMAGVRVGDFALYHGWLDQWVQGHVQPDLSLHVRFGLILGITVLCVTVSTGLLLGLALMNWKASLILAVSTGIVSVLAALLTLIILDRLGIRVGSGNAAMPKATAVSTMAAALAGGAILGVGFSRYVSGVSPKQGAG
jgi:hypothetical protein